MYTFHVTFADQPEVQELAAQARQRLAGLDGLDLVPGQWLHLTTQGVGFTDEVTDSDLAAIIGAAGTRLADASPVALTLAPPRVASEGIACRVWPEEALTRARDALRAAVGEVRGTERIPEGPEWSPHVSVGVGRIQRQSLGDGSRRDHQAGEPAPWLAPGGDHCPELGHDLALPGIAWS